MTLQKDMKVVKFNKTDDRRSVLSSQDSPSVLCKNTERSLCQNGIVLPFHSPLLHLGVLHRCKGKCNKNTPPGSYVLSLC